MSTFGQDGPGQGPKILRTCFSIRVRLVPDGTWRLSPRQWHCAGSTGKSGGHPASAGLALSRAGPGEVNHSRPRTERQIIARSKRDVIWAGHRSWAQVSAPPEVSDSESRKVRFWGVASRRVHHFPFLMMRVGSETGEKVLDKLLKTVLGERLRNRELGECSVVALRHKRISCNTRCSVARKGLWGEASRQAPTRSRRVRMSRSTRPVPR